MMKLVATTIVIGVVAALTGCSQGISGGPGAYGVPIKEEVEQGQDIFNNAMLLMVPKQRETKALSLGKLWVKYFSEEESIKFAGSPRGATIAPGIPYTRLRLKTADRSVPKRNSLGPLVISGWE